MTAEAPVAQDSDRPVSEKQTIECSRSAPDQPAPQPPARRLVSLDAFRGLAILGMLLVNEKVFGPATPVQLRHASWNQNPHFADMVFPWFLLIVGVAIPYAAASRRARATSRGGYYLGILRRTVILVLLGMLINSSYAHRPVFNMGVLQLIGLAYFVAALVYDLPTAARLLVVAVFLISHWAAIRFVPVPGVGAGVFTEEQNLIKYLHEAYLGHRLAGIIGVVPTSALVLIGTAIGDILRREPAPPMRKVGALLGAGLGLVALGWLWNFDLRFNKPYWTASFVVFAAGWGSLVLGVFYLLIDVKRRRAWAFPLVVAGINAIFIYVVPILVKLHTLREWSWPAPGASAVTLEHGLQNLLFLHLGRVPGGVLYTFCYIFFWWLVVLWMYRRKVFLRV